MQQIEAAVNVRRSRIEAMLKVLEVDGAVERADGGWRRTLAPWSYDGERVERVTALRRAEQRAMQEYGTTTECRMVYLRDQLDDKNGSPCGRCDNCTGRNWDFELNPDLIRAAGAYLQRRVLVIEPRRQWPGGLAEAKGRISPDRQLLPGRALSIYNDAGWGRLVRRGKYDEQRFPDELVAAAGDLVRQWAPDPSPEWLTCIPSASTPGLVRDFAERLAATLGVEFRDVIRRAGDRRPQKEMENSAQQFRNTYGVFEVSQSIPSTPVLLVDDIVDSRWTLTIVGAALRDAGSGPVHPLALAQAVSR